MDGSEASATTNGEQHRGQRTHHVADVLDAAHERRHG
jgi:hypothetical protein